MSIYDQRPIDLTPLRTYSLFERPSKVSVRDFAKPHERGAPVKVFLESLPRVLAGEDFRALVESIHRARRRGKPVLAGLGGHVIKCGLAPILIDLLRRRLITGVAMTGAGLIHDFEIALCGATSEDVDASLGEGQFGMAEETGRLINEAISEGYRDGLGLGEALGRALHRLDPPYKAFSLLHAAYAERVPVTVHISLGADITHLHPSASGAAIGATSHRDFLLFCTLVREMDGGGVYLNLGSAVMLPEVFLKAVTVARNLGVKLQDITTANFDFIQHYRPMTNVVRRPVAGVGRGFALTGHHEILIPLLAAALIEWGE
ncbi:hypothetical protein HRbin10_01661 [bacterium HR10]|nr:hypothetical protein HRbin10_01661 [bacterium HR10]